MGSQVPTRVPGIGEVLFAGATGIWLALALIKFGNPVILDERIATPKSLLELIVQPWPTTLGYWLLAAVGIASLKVWRRRTQGPTWLIALPVSWLMWQMVSAIQTVDAALTKATLNHFASCVVSFYLGLFALTQVKQLRLFWVGLMGGFLVVIVVGWEQHFGGLEETRRFFYQMPNWQEYPPEFIKKLGSDRIYSTLFYPNTLAGVIILLLPIVIAILWQFFRSSSIRIAFASVVALCSLACLYWSGSKSGWLIMLTMALIAFLHWPVRRQIKVLAVVAVLSVGLGVFFIKFSDYFSRGATSVWARMDYWRVAARIVQEKPLLGSGPGTFMIMYKRMKAPDAEMSRLVHNDYLQQGADSGLIGLATYMTFVAGTIGLLYRRTRESPVSFAVWLGVVGAAAQGFVEFGLYIPAMAWPQFLFLGWLWGTTGNQIDNAQQSNYTREEE